MNKLQPSPPAWIIKFIEWICPERYQESIIGDFYEQYESKAVSSSQLANIQLFYNAIKLIHPYIIFKNKVMFKFINTAILANHLKVAYRSMLKYKFYSGANLLGLSLATALLLLIILFVRSELNYEQFHSKKDNIYRIANSVIDLETDEIHDKSAVTPVPVSADVHAELSSVINFTRYGSSSLTVISDNIPFQENIVYIDPGFFQMFDFPFLEGDQKTALLQKDHMIISKGRAEKFFGMNNPIGKEMQLNVNDTTLRFTIAGVIDNRIQETSFDLEVMIPFEHYETFIGPKAMKDYNQATIESFILTTEGTDAITLVSSINDVARKHIDDEEVETIFDLQPLTSIRLEDRVPGNMRYTSPMKIKILVALAVLVLIIACLNYLMLSTSHALIRLKELGLRKTMGAYKTSIKKQLIWESTILTFIAGVIGSIIAVFALPTFNNLIEAELVISLKLENILLVLSISTLIGLICGFIQSTIVLKNDNQLTLHTTRNPQSRESNINQALVIAQFTFSMVLITGTLIIRSQLNYIMNKDLGYDKDHLIELHLGNTAGIEEAKLLVDRFRAQALQNNRIQHIAGSMNNAQDPWTIVGFRQENGGMEKIGYNHIDPQYIKALSLNVIEGNTFSELKQEKNAIIVNQALVDHFSWENPLEQQIPGIDFRQPHRIIGVVDNFHFGSLHNKIGPLILATDANAVIPAIAELSTYHWPPSYYKIFVKFNPGQIQPVIQDLEQLWKSNIPNKPFEYRFVDDVLANLYADEMKWKKIINTASIFAIVVAWLGLLGLTRLAVQRRTKEIGIRKVLGSSIQSILFVFSKRFLLLISISIVIGIPITWWLAENWLRDYPYRIEIEPFQFLIVAVIILALTAGSVVLQTIGVALKNPVESLKYE